MRRAGEGGPRRHEKDFEPPSHFKECSEELDSLIEFLGVNFLVVFGRTRPLSLSESFRGEFEILSRI